MNIIGIYPVSSQPPHLGHYRAYEYLKNLTGANTFVATSNNVELPKAPLNFYEKQQIWTRHGVPIDKVVEVKDPNKAVEITKKFGPDRTVAVFAMPRFSVADIVKKSGGYFKVYQGNKEQLEPMSKHAYVLVIPDEVIMVNKSVTPVTIRKAFSSQNLSIDQKKSFFKQVFGWYDISLFDLISKKFAEANVVKERIQEGYDESVVFRRTLKPFIKEILKELDQTSQPTLNPALQGNSIEAKKALDAQKKVLKLAHDDELDSEKEKLNHALKKRELDKKIGNDEVDDRRHKIDALRKHDPTKI